MRQVRPADWLTRGWLEAAPPTLIFHAREKLAVTLARGGFRLLAALAVSGAHVIMGQWADVRQGHADDRVYSGIQSELGQLQGLIGPLGFGAEAQVVGAARG